MKRISIDRLRVNILRLTKKPLHFLHIGKTGGSAIKYTLQDHTITKKYYVHLHKHRVNLNDIKKGQKFFFIVRDPIDRFISAFYSRKRKGAPKFYFEWTDEERKAFSVFSNPNLLAESIFSPEPKSAKMASDAMKAIYHVNTSYWDWFISEEYFKSRIDDLFFIGEQKSLDQSFDVLKQKLELPEYLSLPSDPVIAHMNPKDLDKNLSELAITNLKKWYKTDYDFISICNDLQKRI